MNNISLFMRRLIWEKKNHHGHFLFAKSYTKEMNIEKNSYKKTPSMCVTRKAKKKKHVLFINTCTAHSKIQKKT